ncbi:hypothetical protein K470DRAFT_276663 [Piedraia hortae CBS 480.64]|uniref:Uncharacterized protein n=1 Tax=Piedraia hortae CBS 480.64 TaxID=1314780 RepID=A0A6A7C063_9PEZI|nr:hypothetical protein K470DRAFT_276663 [Piedraia hortae CBS 480.64]
MPPSPFRKTFRYPIPQPHFEKTFQREELPFIYDTASELEAQQQRTRQSVQENTRPRKTSVPKRFSEFMLVVSIMVFWVLIGEDFMKIVR